MLLDVGADYSSADSNGATALHYAALNNHAKTVGVRLRSETMGAGRPRRFYGARRLTHRCSSLAPASPMSQTWRAGQRSCGRPARQPTMPLPCGFDITLTFSRWTKMEAQVRLCCHSSPSPLCFATTCGKSTSVISGLHAAALSGHASTVRLLLEHGCDIDCQDLLMHTPLFRACEMGHTDVVQALIDGGAQIEVIDQDGRSPLHWWVVVFSCLPHGWAGSLHGDCCLCLQGGAGRTRLHLPDSDQIRHRLECK